MESVGAVTIHVDRIILIWATVALVSGILVLVAFMYRLLKRINVAQKHNFQTINRYQENAQHKLDALIARVDEAHRKNADGKLDVILGKIREYGL